MSDTNDTQAQRPHSAGPGPFVTHRVVRIADGRLRVATSRRHRKGLAPHEVDSLAGATSAPTTRPGAFRHVLAPRRLGWWIAVLFALGSLQFLLAALAATWPDASLGPLRDGATQGRIFFTGSLCFTTAAWLQWLEALNGDVATALEGGPRRWRWFGWCPRNLGYLAAAVQLVGTVLFNFDTRDAMLANLSWQDQAVLVWLPNMLGSVCFLVASYLAYAEVSHGAASFAPRSVSWWIAIANLVGSVAFQLSALASFTGPEPLPPALSFWSTLLTAAGALCFLIGAYLLIPELFDE